MKRDKQNEIQAMTNEGKAVAEELSHWFERQHVNEEIAIVAMSYLTAGLILSIARERGRDVLAGAKAVNDMVRSALNDMEANNPTNMH